MNSILIGAADKTSRLIERAGNSFLIIDDGPIAGAFLNHFPRAKLFDVSQHTFNPLKGIDYKRARDFAQAIYTASPEGKETLTVRNGKRALTRILLEGQKRLDQLSVDISEPGVQEVVETIKDMLLSPVLKHVLCNPTNFSFKGQVVVKLDRAVIGDFDAFILASLLIGQAKGQIIVPDFGFYSRDFYMSLIRQNRLMACVHTLSELSPKLRDAMLLIKDKHGEECTHEDALTLALYAGLIPGTNEHTDFVQQTVSQEPD